jgi:hypothetical protein
MMNPILADMGVPMLFLQMPAMLAALLPIIIIEALFVRSRLSLSYREAFVGISIANVVSTLFGIPVAWFILVVPEMFFESHLNNLYQHLHNDPNSPIWNAFAILATFPWLDPDESRLYWMVPVASTLLLVPSYFASVWLERPICRRLWRQTDAFAASRAVTNANRLSYAALFVLACCWLGYSIQTHKMTGKPNNIRLLGGSYSRSASLVALGMETSLRGLPAQVPLQLHRQRALSLARPHQHSRIGLFLRSASCHVSSVLFPRYTRRIRMTATPDQVSLCEPLAITPILRHFCLDSSFLSLSCLSCLFYKQE